MRINEIILENEQLDELSLAGIGRGIGRVATGVGKTVGGAVGGARAVGANIRTGYQKGYQGAQDSVLARAFPTDDQRAQAARQAQRPGVTTPQPTAAAPTTQVAPAPTTQVRPAAPANLDGIKRAYSTLDPAAREKLKKDLEVIDDRERLATGSNESIESLLKLAGR